MAKLYPTKCTFEGSRIYLDKKEKVAKFDYHTEVSKPLLTFDGKLKDDNRGENGEKEENTEEIKK